MLERAVHIVRHTLDLHLLVDELVLDLVDPDVEPLDVHLRVLGSGLRSFKPGHYKVKSEDDFYCHGDAINKTLTCRLCLTSVPISCGDSLSKIRPVMKLI